MYHKGTLEGYQNWHSLVKKKEGIDDKGKIYCVGGIPKSAMKRTTKYCDAIPHPVDVGSCIWVYGDYKDETINSFTKEEVIELGWFPSSEVV